MGPDSSDRRVREDEVGVEEALVCFWVASPARF